jgi:hypothetical protein
MTNKNCSQRLVKLLNKAGLEGKEISYQNAVQWIFDNFSIKVQIEKRPDVHGTIFYSSDFLRQKYGYKNPEFYTEHEAMDDTLEYVVSHVIKNIKSENRHKLIKKTFSVFKKKDGDICFVVRMDDNTINFNYIFNSISRTYMGFYVESFIDSLYVLLKEYPNFIKESKDFIGSQTFENWLIEKCFVKTELTNTEEMLYL